MTFNEASNYCKLQGGDLATINSEDMQEFLEEEFLGLSKTKKNIKRIIHI